MCAAPLMVVMDLHTQSTLFMDAVSYRGGWGSNLYVQEAGQRGSGVGPAVDLLLLLHESPREGLSASPKRSSQMPSRGCSSLPSSQPEPLQQGGSAVPQGSLKPAVEPPEEQQGAPQAPEPPRPGAADPQKRVSQQAVNSTVTSTPSKVCACMCSCSNCECIVKYS